MREGNGGDGNEDAGNILGNERVFQLFMDAIDNRVATRFRERSEGNRTWLVPLAAALVAVAVGAGTLTAYILELNTSNAAFEAEARATAAIEAKAVSVEADLVGKLQNALQEEMAIRFAAIRFDGQIAALNFRAQRMDLAEGFTTEDAKSILTEIETLYSQQTDAESRNKLTFAIETAARNFAQINRPEFVLRLEEIAPDLFQTSGTISELMVQLLGNRLLADAGSASWLEAEGSARKTYDNYRRYADRANDTGYPELYSAYELLLRFAEERPVGEIVNLIEDLSDLNEVDSGNFVQLMTRLAIGNLGIAGDDRVAERTVQFLCQHRAQSMLLSAALENADLQCLMSH